MSDGGKKVWEKGGPSPNPTGRPKAVYSVVEMARAHTPLAINTLAHICEKGESESARVAAAIHLLDRAWQRCPQRVDILMLQKKLHELTADELATLEQRLTAIPAIAASVPDLQEPVH